MAILHGIESTMDIILTQKGREKLAKGQLVIKYYAFGDDEVDYRSQNGVTIPSPGPIPGTFIISSDGSFFVDESGNEFVTG